MKKQFFYALFFLFTLWYYLLFLDKNNNKKKTFHNIFIFNNKNLQIKHIVGKKQYAKKKTKTKREEAPK